MSILRTFVIWLKQPASIILVIVVTISVVSSVLAYRLTVGNQAASSVPTPITAPIPTLPPSPTVAPTPIPTKKAAPEPIILPPEDPSQIQGLDAGTGNKADKLFPGISWFRISYPTCGWGGLRGQFLKDTIQYYHSKGIRVLFVVCQTHNPNSVDWNTIAHSYPDAVQCGNEEMKQDASVSFLYMPPDEFANFYNTCERAIHAVNSKTPTLVGSLDPHVAGADYQLMQGQAYYLNQMQYTMNTTLKRGNWNWHNQILGVIDSWYNGYSGANNLAGVFDFWAQEFNVDVNSGKLGRHLWVVEGTACYKGCGINGGDPAVVAIVHILTLISNTETSLSAHVPYFHFSGKDIQTPGDYGPTGVLDLNGHPKPLRQDQPMGAYRLTLTCPGNKHVTVTTQLDLMVRLYTRCALPPDYATILSN
ncbi:MAG: hypothetical protein JO215_15465 [Ktedonobacteraceae bacterium]|nr:hypothetical protein [Ktedonobacteraceae bacterium]